jgi:hypothetical protein
MTTRPTSQDVRWMAAGALVLGLFMLVLWRFRQDPAQQLAFKVTRVDVVARMEAGLASASEAEKSAVLATGDQDSQRFADQARAASAEVERLRQALGALLARGGTDRERELLAQFSEAFAALQRVDDEVLALAVKNTNLKAYALLFGPAAEALAELDGALARVVARRADAPDGKRTVQLASAVRIGALRIQTLLAPHVAEESDAGMDRLEAAMRVEERRVRASLDGLVAQPALAGDADVAAAAAAFARYGEVEGRILALSRENTNVRSLALSVGQKRKALALCLEPLGALKQALLDEPIAGVSYGKLPTR